MSTPLESTKSGATAISKVSYTHDAMIDVILANPKMKQGDIAKYFGYTESWVSRVMGSDAFNARLAARKTEVVDPSILASFEERIQGLANQSLAKLSEKIDMGAVSVDQNIKIFEATTKALGLGARQASIQQQNNYVVALPPKVETEQGWAQAAGQAAKELAEKSRLAREAATDVQSREIPS
jgi:hypothetical protein